MSIAVQKVPEPSGVLGAPALYPLLGELVHGGPHVVHRDDQVVEATGLYLAAGRVVHQLQGHERVTGKLQHREVADR